MFTDVERGFYYQARGITPGVVREIEEMRLQSPARPVSQRGLKNIVVDFYSNRNGERRVFESYTGEFLYGLELEVFGRCHEYYVQVQPRNIVRYGRTNSMTIDFMVIDPDGIRLVECKPLDRLERLAAKRPDEWQCVNGIWTRPAVNEWAAGRGLKYEIWVPPRPHGIYQANLLTLYGMRCTRHTGMAEARCITGLRKALATQTLTIQEAIEQIHGLTGAHVIAALAQQYVYGLLRSVPLDEIDRFILYPSHDQSFECDRSALEILNTNTTQPSFGSPTLRAAPIDYARGMKRLARVRRMIAGEEVTTRRYSALVRRVVEAEVSGRNALEVCLTSLGQSGRRIGQLTEDQEAALAWAIKRYRSDPLVRTKLQAHDLLRIHCEDKGLRAPGRTTLTRRIRRLCPTVRAYTEGGYRGYHAAELATDPIDRTQRCLVPGLMVHVDATKYDVRCSPDIQSGLGFDCPTIYIAVDSATGYPLGRALMFGPACRNALAVLIRDIYLRQGFLPRYWIVDNGAEYTGAWFEAFCSLYGATRIQPPPGSPRKNSLAENALGRINKDCSHRFLGSTAPDQRGRSVTSRQKSVATARHNYRTVLELTDQYVFGDMPAVPHAANRFNAEERRSQLIEIFGHAGLVEVKKMDDFLLATSIPIDRDIKVDPTRGIRYLLRRYSSTDLLLKLRTHNPIEKRLDCVNPHRMYVRFPSGWVLATTPEALSAGGRSNVENLFETLTDSAARSENESIRTAVRVERTRRIEEANSVAESTSYLSKLSEATSPRSGTVNKDSLSWDLAPDVVPFDVEIAE